MENISFLFAIISGIIAIIALITPLITTLMTQSGGQKLKKTELLFAARTAAYTKFLEEMSFYQHHISVDNFEKLKTLSASAMLFSSEETSFQISEYLVTASDCLSHLNHGFVEDVQLFNKLSLLSEKVLYLLKDDIVSL